jgi:hypothetical protein
MRELPEELRAELKEPLGPVVDEGELVSLLQNKSAIVAVGDFVTFTLLKHKITPIVSIVDFIIERKQYALEMKERIQRFGKIHIKVRNPPGTITDELWNTIENAYANIDNGPYCIEIDGEEDLATLPAIYLASKDVTIIYGLPNKGVVVVTVTKAQKQKVKKILDKM